MDSDEQEAMRLKTLAEEKYKRTNLKSALKYATKSQRICPNLDGISDMVTAFKILSIYSKSSSIGPDWYQILEVEPFSHINSIKKQYKKLALILHPDKNTCVASEEAFKRVSEANQVLSDKIRRKDYDLKLRIALQSQAITEKSVAVDQVETFWTACSRCQLFHEFDRRYIGHFLRCPSCKKSFVAEEVMFENVASDDDPVVEEKQQNRVRTRGTGSVQNEPPVEERQQNRVRTKGSGADQNEPPVEERRHNRVRTMGSGADQTEQPVRRSLRVPVKRKFDNYATSGFGRNSRSKKVEEKPEMTIAEIRLEAKRKLLQEKAKLEEEKKREKEKEEKSKNEKVGAKGREKEKQQREKIQREEEILVESFEKNDDMEHIMVVEDSDFHDFDKDRKERCFKKSQIWSVYDDDDGMPRHYGLIDEVESVNPFVVKMRWLDMERNTDERLISWEKSGFHISCGRFKVSKQIIVESVNVFSHLVNCERVAREVYWIYPKKGSIWALYKEKALSGDEEGQRLTETRSYDIVVSLTSYSEMHGLSLAYLEKVEGFKTIFKRREIGAHAVKWIEKNDLLLFSHQIPAKELSGTESNDLPKGCWELDPASLPPDLLRIGWQN
ncbi:hypothetical protein ACHQM5_007923 [Ranunculus cassubicifolius]